MKDIELTNDFHGTAVVLRAPAGRVLSAWQVRKSWRALCGFDGCRCCDALGRRGPQADRVEEVAPGVWRVISVAPTGTGMGVRA
jgi:hypothetical protein